MSYDIYLRSVKCDACGRYDSAYVKFDSPTYNLTPIFDLALTGEPLLNANVSEFQVVILKEKTDRPRGLRMLSGRRAGDTIELLSKAISRLLDPAWEKRFRELEPENKWGTINDARDVMAGLRSDAEKNPDFVWEIH